MMKGFGVPTVVLCTIVGCLNAGWWRTYGEGWVKSVQRTGDGYALFGNYSDGSFILRTDDLGNEVFYREYGILEEGFGSFGCLTRDGGYAITGGYFEQRGKLGFYSLRVLKADSQGEVLWGYSKEDFNPPWRYMWGYCVRETDDGNYIVLGSIEWQPLIILLGGSEHTSIWEKLYEFEYGAEGYCIEQASDGGYIIAGRLVEYAGESLFLFKIGELGDSSWLRIYGVDYGNEGRWIEQTTDGGYIIAGTVNASDEGVYGGVNLWLLKTDSSGDTIWTRTYGGERIDKGYCVRQTADGGYIVAGYTNSFGAGDDDLWLLKTDSSGDTLWTRTYGGDSTDRGYSVLQDSDGGYIAGGSTKSFGSDWINSYLIKTDSLGLLGVEEPPSSPVTPVTPVTHLEITNPIGSEITLRYSNCPQGFHASIFDASGRKVDEIQSPQTQGVTPWGGGRGPGVYFIVSDEGSSQVSKVILVR